VAIDVGVEFDLSIGRAMPYGNTAWGHPTK